MQDGLEVKVSLVAVAMQVATGLQAVRAIPVARDTLDLPDLWDQKVILELVMLVVQVVLAKQVIKVV